MCKLYKWLDSKIKIKLKILFNDNRIIIKVNLIKITWFYSPIFTTYE